MGSSTLLQTRPRGQPMGSSSFPLTTVERALAKEKGSAMFGSLGLDRRVGVLSSMQHVLQNWKSLLNLKVRED